MRSNQKFTPKYWVGHRKDSDEILIVTMYKSRRDTWDAMTNLLGEDWEHTDKYYINLVEVKIICLGDDTHPDSANNCEEEGDW